MTIAAQRIEQQTAGRALRGVPGTGRRASEAHPRRQAVMERTILFAIDDDEMLAAALPVVGAYARPWDAGVRVLHVVRRAAGGAGRVAETDQEAEGILRRGVEAVEAGGARATGEIVTDPSVAGAIVAAARRHGADLVVLGSRRPSHLGGLVLGSVGHEVIHQLRRPGLLARHVRQAAVR